MAIQDTLTITFKLDDSADGLKKLTLDADGFRKVIKETIKETERFKSSAINFAAVATSINSINGYIEGLLSSLKSLTDLHAVQTEAETKLATVMRNTMDAREEDIQSIKKLCAAQQELGVIGDEVQLAGAQELATYLTEKQSLEQLIPVMNDMLAQQYGLNATQENAANIATMLGKVMDGQTGALSRYGYSFDEAQEKILKFGTESERAAVLCDVVKASVGGVNAELAKTDDGKQKQLENTIGDLKEQLGGLVQGALPFITIAANTMLALTGTLKFVATVKTAAAVIQSWKIKQLALNGALIVGTGSIKKAAVATEIYAAAAKDGARKALIMKTAIRGLLIASGVIGALIALTAVIWHFSKTSDDAADAASDAASEFSEWKKSLTDISSSVGQIAAKEMQSLNKLYDAATDDTKKREERLRAVAELQKQYPDYFGKLDREAIMVGKAKTAYDNLTDSILAASRARAAEKQLDELQAQKIKLEIDKEDAQATADKARNELASAQKAKDDYDAKSEQRDKENEGKTIRVNGEDVQIGATGIPYAEGASLRKHLQEKREASAAADRRLNDLNKQSAVVDKAIEKMVKVAQSANTAVLSTENGIPDTPTPSQNKPIWSEHPETIRQYSNNIQILSDRRQDAKGEELEEINRQIAEYRESMAKLESTGAGKVWIENAESIAQMSNNLSILQEQLDEAESDESAAKLNKQISELEAKIETRKNAGKEPEKPEDIAKLNTLEEVENAISYYQEQQKKASADEVKNIQETINALERKRKVLMLGTELPSMQEEVEEINSLSGQDFLVRIKGIGFENLTSKIKDLQKLLDDTENPLTEQQRNDVEGLIATYKKWRKECVMTFDTFRNGYDSLKSIGSGVESITGALEGNGNAWQTVTGIVDGFLQMYDGVKTIVDIINELILATNILTESKIAEAGATGTATAATVAGATASTAAATQEVTAATEVATAKVEEAAAKTMAAHAGIPWVGIAIAGGMVVAMTAVMLGLPKFANGGIVSGPTVGLIGEYAGASRNPEVVAPLDRLRDLIGSDDDRTPRVVKFKIEGRTLVGIMEKELNFNKRR